MARIFCASMLCIVVFCLIAPAVWAATQDEAPFDENKSRNNQFLAIGIGFGMAIAVFGGALGQGRAIAASVEAMARQPEAGGRIMGAMIIGLALIETLVIYMLLIAFILQGKFAALPA